MAVTRFDLPASADFGPESLIDELRGCALVISAATHPGLSGQLHKPLSRFGLDALAFNGTSNALALPEGFLSATGGYDLFAAFRVNALPSVCGFIAASSNSAITSSNPIISGLALESTGQITALTRGSSGAVRAVTTTEAVAAGEEACAFARVGKLNRSVSLNGGRIYAGTSTTTGMSGAFVHLGGGATAYSAYPDYTAVDIGLIVMAPIGSISDELAARACRDPGVLFRRRAWMSVSAGGGTAAISSASGSATASTIAGASTAAATVGQASGAATASALAGASTSAAAISSATGASTASTLAGNATSAATLTAAAGASIASTVAGASTAASAISAAAGVSTAGTLAGVTGTGANISAAAGAATAESMAGAATAAAAISAATGAATASTAVGAAIAAAAMSAAAGAATASTLVGSTVGEASAISPAAGVASAQIIVGASFAAAAIGAASGSANARTLTGSDGLIDTATALARYTITAAPRLTTITAAARRLEINR